MPEPYKNIENIDICMVRANLEGIPAHPLPNGFTLRWYEPGDAQHWIRIHEEADILNTIHDGLFMNEFGEDESALSERQLYLCTDDGEVVGTSTAWWMKHQGTEWGHVHWVAIAPKYQRQGLAKPLMARTLERLRSLGHDKAILITSSARLVAVRMYMKLGFMPEIRNEQEREGWRIVQKYYPNPYLRDL